MPKGPVVCLALVLLLLGALNAQDEKKAKKVVKNADIVLMAQNRFDDETLTKIIEVSDTDFDVSTDALVELMRQGVSSNVCRAMLAATRKKRAAAPAPNPEPSAASASTPAAAPTPSISPASAQPSATAPASANSPDPNFAARPCSTGRAESDGAATPSNPPPGASPSPARPVANPAAMYPGAMDVNPQMAMVQAELASLGMGGLLGGMGMGGMAAWGRSP